MLAVKGALARCSWVKNIRTATWPSPNIPQIRRLATDRSDADSHRRAVVPVKREKSRYQHSEELKRNRRLQEKYRPPQSYLKIAPETVEGKELATPKETFVHEDEVKVGGKHVVETVFKNRPNDIVKLYMTEEVAQDKSLGPMLSWLAQNKKAYKVVTPDELKRLTKSVHHEGICAVTKQKKAPDMHEMLWKLVDEGSPTPLVLLDGVANPHNVGAIVRVCANFGVKTLFVVNADTPANRHMAVPLNVHKAEQIAKSKQQQAIDPPSDQMELAVTDETKPAETKTDPKLDLNNLLSPAVYRTSMGACEYVEVVDLPLSNLRKLLSILRRYHYKLIATAPPKPGVVSLYSPKIKSRIGLGVGGKTPVDTTKHNTPPKATPDDLKTKGRVVLMLGSESHGLSKYLYQYADIRVSIPGAGNVESLNVAQAGAVVLAELWRLQYRPVKLVNYIPNSNNTTQKPNAKNKQHKQQTQHEEDEDDDHVDDVVDEDDELEELGLDAVDNMGDNVEEPPSPSSPSSVAAPSPPKHSHKHEKKSDHNKTTKSSPSPSQQQPSSQKQSSQQKENTKPQKKLNPNEAPTKVDLEFDRPSKYEADAPIQPKKKKPFKKRF